MSGEKMISLGDRLATGGALPTEDILHAILPLMNEVAALHAIGRVADLDAAAVRDAGDGRLGLVRPQGTMAAYNDRRLREVQPHAGSALRIVGEYRVATDVEAGSRVDDLRVRGDDAEGEYRPAYLTGYRAWEQVIGHHDEVADIFVLGLILASLACGLDLSDEEDVARFSANQANLFRLNGQLHPVIASLIAEMTALNRHERATDLGELARRLENYRDQPAGIDVERAPWRRRAECRDAAPRC